MADKPKPSQIPDRFPVSPLGAADLDEVRASRNLQALSRSVDGYFPSPNRRRELEQIMPYPLGAAIPGVTVFPYEGNWSATGAVATKKRNPAGPDRMYVNTWRSDMPWNMQSVASTGLHEAEHLHERRSGRPVVTEFARLYPPVQSARTRHDLEQTLRKLGPVLQSRRMRIFTDWTRRTNIPTRISTSSSPA